MSRTSQPTISATDLESVAPTTLLEPDLTEEQALALLEQLSQQAYQLHRLIESQQQELAMVKNQAQVLVSLTGGKYRGEYGSFIQVKPGSGETYDTGKLDGLISVLKANGLTQTARAIEGCQKTTHREGYLRFDPNRSLSD
jgi:hypothetical protein